MPCEYVIDKQRRLVISTGSDRFTFSEAKAHQEKLIADPDFNREFNQLIDLRAVTLFELTVEETRTIAMRNPFSPQSRRALVASSPHVFGMLRLAMAHHEMIRGASEASAFYDANAAMKWLGNETQETSEDLKHPGL
jgi:hypothetical protein